MNPPAVLVLGDVPHAGGGGRDLGVVAAIVPDRDWNATAPAVTAGVRA